MNTDIENLINILSIFIFFIVIATGINVFNAHQESSTFNKLCRGKTTIIDALFAELRVDGSCKGGN
jgi:hypothetical protein